MRKPLHIHFRVMAQLLPIRGDDFSVRFPTSAWRFGLASLCSEGFRLGFAAGEI